ncbi:aminotransferase class I/II-fold pyridoxal phosphate-dependent enzyme [Papillibacter cinnamivorans]|uniref:Cystathionine beta-lyase family protein involved in aluminum resistance n=1 Tax=Papillibacter cinnamivorans DSM 12816 TaxID=1122930 RepID=A0A1W1ZQM6_9FIRM|nr:methionine gamma-lyase family protein [Papillibacter cinnamivorans]SMC50706.1 Cystathionine beta-lyase family protein involved in aluminum resistance [Papillibacter cinnamivorans DSM 12816]
MKLGDRAQSSLTGQFSQIDATAEENTRKVLSAFRKNRVSDGYFAGTTGYGYDDRGRDMLDAVYADVFRAEDALVRVGFVNGTHAIATALFGVLRPGDVLLSAVGAPYDTLQGVIGIEDRGPGSLREFGVGYRQAEPRSDGSADLDAIAAAAADPSVRCVLVQRSRGYSGRRTLSVSDIGEICARIRAVNPEAAVVVDNCYGEFVERTEPAQAGADLVAGSLIKNPGGGLAPTGGYIAGRRELVRRAAMHLTAPGIGKECGPSLGQNRLLYQGLFLAPHVTAQALKTAVFASRVMELLGYGTDPAPGDIRRDIVQRILFGEPEALKRFCRGIQKGSPVDSYVTPEPWDMPGYGCQVIMAAGTFIQGASVELSCDAPMREPFAVYLQGGLTFESGKLGVLSGVQTLLYPEEE